MVHKSEKYQKATDFRKRGFTYSEISKIVGVSRSTLSNWFSKQSFSRKIKKDNEIRARKDNVKRIAIVNKSRHNERLKQYQRLINGARKEFKHYKATPLFISGLAIYMTAGDLGHPSQIRLPSQRSEVHKLFGKFLKEFLGPDKAKIYNKNGVTIVNDVLAKKKLLAWIDQLG